MRIECPSCQAVYEVPDALLAGGPRMVRCARCGKDWQPTPMAEEAAAAGAKPEPAAPPPAAAPPAPPPAPAREPVREPAPPPDPPPAPPPPRPTRPPATMRLVEPPVAASRRRGGPVVALAWLASLAALGAMGWAGLTMRADILAAWPASARLYAWLGLLP